MTTIEQINEFWALKRIAVVGVSRDPKHFSYAIWQELRQRRYEVVPVNPNTDLIDGQACYARVQDIDPPVEAALILTPSSQTASVVRDCVAAGVRRVWLHRGAGGGPGAVSAEAVELCEANGIDAVVGQCPFMFLSDTPFFHTIHRTLRKLTGGYPKSAAGGAR